MKAVKISTLVLPLTIALGGALAPASFAADTAYPSADIPQPGPPPLARVLTTQESERLVRSMADGRAPLGGDVTNGATAMCADNTVTRTRDPLEACAFHGGVDHWFTPGPRRNVETIAG
ncbi:MAG: hypothetical protein JWN73_4542 [Betaproteobacteria bacterium]|nr:hypothetical protein [Betaproteobacteria bacterium]